MLTIVASVNLGENKIKVDSQKKIKNFTPENNIEEILNFISGNGEDFNIIIDDTNSEMADNDIFRIKAVCYSSELIKNISVTVITNNPIWIEYEEDFLYKVIESYGGIPDYSVKFNYEANLYNILWDKIENPTHSKFSDNISLSEKIKNILNSTSKSITIICNSSTKIKDIFNPEFNNPYYR